MSDGGSGGVSVRAGASPALGGSRAALRKAQRRALVRQGRTTDLDDDAGPLCAVVCGGCGRLQWPAESAAAHPLRDEAALASPRLGPCPHCRETSWIDLRLGSTALALRDGEHSDTRDGASRRRELALHGGVATALGLFAGIVTLGAAWSIAVVGLGTGLVATLVKHRELSRGASSHADLPRRWSLALPPNPSPPRVSAGAAVLLDEPLHAPLSGRACVAWEVGLRGDAQPEAAFASWTLLEQRVARLRVADHEVDPSVTHLELVRRPAGCVADHLGDPAAAAYLRQRGFGLADADQWVYESVVPLDVGVRVCAGPEGAILRPDVTT